MGDGARVNTRFETPDGLSTLKLSADAPEPPGHAQADSGREFLLARVPRDSAARQRLCEAQRSTTAGTQRHLGEYRQEILDQAKQIARTSESNSVVDAMPQVQLQFTAAGIDARVRYPVQLQHTAEIDERVSEALLQVIRSASG